MQTLWERTFVKRPDRACERCGASPASFHGHCDLENGPSPEDFDPGIWIDGKAYLWLCDDCEHLAWVRSHQEAEAACRRHCGPVCVMACYDTEGLEEATCTS